MNFVRNIGARHALPAIGAFAVTAALGSSAISANAELNTMMPTEETAVEIELVPEVEAADAAAPAPSANIDFVSKPVVQDVPEEEEVTPEPRNTLGYSDADMLCLAKIVHHESANQRESVQLAVASVVLNRVESPRFPSTICGVALQPKQFFNVHAYRPYSDPRWSTSQRIAREAVQGKGRNNAPGAMFFRTAGYQSAFFRSRPHIARLGGLDFHR